MQFLGFLKSRMHRANFILNARIESLTKAYEKLEKTSSQQETD